MKNILLPLVFGLIVLSGCCSLPGLTDEFKTKKMGLPAGLPVTGDYNPYEAYTGQVMVNNYVFSTNDKRAFQNFYRTPALPGNYWYDSKSGLYGRMYQQGVGFIMPHHNFGVMDPTASHGYGGVFLNGRELTANEIGHLESAVNFRNQPGRYFLDEYGNFGEEGSTTPIGNIFGSPRRSPAEIIRSSWAGGDKFWSTGYTGDSIGACTYVNRGGNYVISGCG